jgi:hypothetical protein
MDGFIKGLADGFGIVAPENGAETPFCPRDQDESQGTLADRIVKLGYLPRGWNAH